MSRVASSLLNKRVTSSRRSASCASLVAMLGFIPGYADYRCGVPLPGSHRAHSPAPGLMHGLVHAETCWSGMRLATPAPFPDSRLLPADAELFPFLRGVAVLHGRAKRVWLAPSRAIASNE